MLRLYILFIFIVSISGHGRLIGPPGRGSAWRFGFKTPVDYNDEGLYCGGYSSQWNNNGQCGVCGDAFTSASPRNHELFGRYVRNPPVIVQQYQKSSTIDVKVQLTANHGGFFIFQLCPANNQTEVTEECLQSNSLLVVRSEDASKVLDENPVEGPSTLDDNTNNLIETSTEFPVNHPSKQNHYDRHPVDLKKFIQTVKNPLNKDQYNYDINKKDMENANAQVISGKAQFGNRFNPVLDENSKDLKQFKFAIPFERAQTYTVKVKLPTGLTCSRCVLRWIYVAGNSWGICNRKGFKGRVGCGPQEEFRNCADIAIN